MAYETFIGLRQLKARKDSRSVSVITLVSVAGVAVGVWTLVVVLSVMSGFEGDLRDKILGANPHVMVDRRDGNLRKYDEACKKLSGLKGVGSCSPFVSSEAMLTSATSVAGVVVRGLSRRDPRAVIGKKGRITLGRFSHLFRSQRIVDGGVAAAAAAKHKDKKGKGSGKGSRVATKAVSRPASAGSRGGGAKLPLPPLIKPAGPKTARKGVAGSSGPALRPGIIIGKELARALAVTVGDEVRVVSPLGGTLTPLGPVPKARRFRVAALFFTGMYEYDSKLIYITLPEAQRFFSIGNAVTGLELRLADPGQSGRVKRRAARLMGSKLYRVRDWTDLNSRLFAALHLEKIAMFIILTFIVVVASFSIVSTLIMVVIEKAREISILKSMGATAVGIMRIFMVQGVSIGIAGTMIGLTLGVTTCKLLTAFPIKLRADVFYITSVPVRMDWLEITMVAAASVVLCLVATIYPASQAAGLRPVEGLRYD